MNEIYMLVMSALFAVKAKLAKLMTNEDGDVNIVSIVVLIGVAVLLAIVFKDAIGNLIRSLLATITGNASDVVNSRIQ